MLWRDETTISTPEAPVVGGPTVNLTITLALSRFQGDAVIDLALGGITNRYPPCNTARSPTCSLQSGIKKCFYNDFLRDSCTKGPALLSVVQLATLNHRSLLFGAQTRGHQPAAERPGPPGCCTLTRPKTTVVPVQSSIRPSRLPELERNTVNNTTSSNSRW
jgi:hypothetical protein